MKVIYTSSVDWEPLLVMSEFSKILSPKEMDDLNNALKKWLRTRDSQVSRECACQSKWCAARPDEKNSRVARITIQWVCPKCLPELLDILAQMGSILTTVGWGESASALPHSSEWVRVRQQEVEMEDGRKIHVDEFLIRKCPVSVNEFFEFTKESRYMTHAEKQGQRNSCYWNNSFVRQGIPGSATATWLCYWDAIAYCHWKHVRLPTEVELMAAALIDDRIYDKKRDRHILFDKRGKLRNAGDDRALLEFGPELTSTIENGRVLVRSGPYLHRYQNWREQKSIVLHALTYGDAMLHFRVCTEAKVSTTEF